MNCWALLLLWPLGALVLALIIGGGIRLADHSERPPHGISDVHNERMTHATRPTTITPAFIGGGELVHALVGEWTQEQTRGAGIELDSVCGARRRGASRSMRYPGVTVKGPGVSVTCSRCDSGMRRRGLGEYAR